jgi:uncharacterized SAM-binding protein YcdF (DUF218 family)
MVTSGPFLFLSKLLPELVLPLGATFLLLIAALAFGSTRRRQRILVGSALLVLGVGSSGCVSELLVRSLERRYPAPAELPTAPAIVVLGGGTEPVIPPRTDVELGPGGDRLLHAVRLHRAGKAPVILVCAGRVEWSAAPRPEAADMAELLRFMGVPADAILEESRSRTTYENAVEAWRVLQPLGVRRILLVTSALHMPRAVGLFRRVGFDVVPAPTDFQVVDAPPPGDDFPWLEQRALSALPNARNLASTTLALREWMGIGVYRALGLID